MVAESRVSVNALVSHCSSFMEACAPAVELPGPLSSLVTIHAQALVCLAADELPATFGLLETNAASTLFFRILPAKAN